MDESRFRYSSSLRNNQLFFSFFIHLLDLIPINPCSPTPCGPNSECRVVNGQAVCSCVRGFLGSPPTCRPECIVSTDCPQNEACSNQRCMNPCPGTCGIGATCNVVNHNPVCSCPLRYTGDPFVQCMLFRKNLPPPYFELARMAIGHRSFARFFCECLMLFYFSRGTCSRPLPAITLWPELSVSGDQRFSVLLLFARILWQSTKLSSRMR